MNKLIALLLAFIVHTSAMAVAPLGVQGQKDTAKLYPPVVNVPNYQATKVTGGALLETGNKNILANPSFEAPLNAGQFPSWTVADASRAIETSQVVDGKQAGKITFIGDPMDLNQVSTINSTAFADGVQGLASIRIKTSVAGLKVCPIKANVTSTTLCNDVTNDNLWHHYKIPFILGGTNNGISVHSNGVGVSGIIYVDDAFVGPQNLLTEVPTCDGSAECETKFDAYIASGGTHSGENLEWITSSALSDVSLYTLSLNTNIASSAMNCNVSLNSSSTAANETVKIVSVSSTSVVVRTGYGTADTYYVKQPLPFYISCNKTGTDYSKAKATSPGFFSQSVDANRISEVIFNSQTTAPKNFISAMNKSIGKSSGDYQGGEYYALYQILWAMPGLSTTAGDVYRISSAKGASALADWDAGKTITIDYATNEVFVRAKGGARNLGSYQADSFQGHWHASSWAASATLGSGGILRGTGATTDVNDVHSPVSDGTNGTPRTANETRPKNVALNAWIRYSDQEIIVGSFKDLQYKGFIASSSTSRTVATTGSDIVFETEEYDSGIYNNSTGVATIAEKGIYDISSTVYTSPVTLATTERFTCSAYVNGVLAWAGSRHNGNGANQTFHSAISGYLSLNVGDQVKVQCFSNVATTTTASQPHGNRFSILKRPGQF